MTSTEVKALLGDRKFMHTSFLTLEPQEVLVGDMNENGAWVGKPIPAY